MPFTTKARKKPTNLSLPVDLCASAKELGINVSQVCEQALRHTVHIEQEHRWNQQHAAFIAAYNQALEADGVALTEWRAF